MDFKEIQKLAFKAHVEKKYLETWEKAYDVLKEHNLEGLIDLAEVGLFTTEVGETLEEIRDKDEEATAKELGGIIIRILNFASRKGIDLEKVILSEIKRNTTRPDLHGRKLI